LKVILELSNDSVAALAEALVVRLKDVTKPAPTSAPDRFVTRAEAARMGVERRALLRAERSGKLEAFKPGRVVLYRSRDVEALVESHKVVLLPEASMTPEVGLLPGDGFEKALRNAAKRSHRL
jgi:hypothetical protein